MSYISNLVQRTLGVTPVARPIIQAKFAPPVQSAGAAPIAAQRERQTPASPNLLRQQEINRGVQRTRPEFPGQSHVAQGEPQDLGHVSDGSKFAERGLVQSTAGARQQSPTPGVPLESPDGLMEEPPTRENDASNPVHGADLVGDGFRLMSTVAFTPALPRLNPSAAVRSRSSESESTEAPIVRVHIGRVDVRMVAQGSKESRTAPPQAAGAKPASLEDYLRERLRGQR